MDGAGGGRDSTVASGTTTPCLLWLPLLSRQPTETELPNSSQPRPSDRHRILKSHVAQQQKTSIRKGLMTRDSQPRSNQVSNGSRDFVRHQHSPRKCFYGSIHFAGCANECMQKGCIRPADACLLVNLCSSVFNVMFTNAISNIALRA